MSLQENSPAPVAPIEPILDGFENELKRRGVPGNASVVYYPQEDVVILVLKEVKELIEDDGVMGIVRWACDEFKRRGVILRPLDGMHIIDCVASFQHKALLGVEIEKKISVILSYNRFHQKTQLLVGLEDEAKPFVDFLDILIKRHAHDGQNRAEGSL